MTSELRPDVLIMDISMPGMSGIEVLRRLQVEMPAQKVLILSMHGDPHLIRELFRQGVLGYIAKNCSPQELMEAIRTVAAGELFGSQGIGESDAAGPSPLEQEPNRPIPVNLTPREREVLHHIASGMNAKEIAFQLNVSLKTIEYHRLQIMKKLNLYSLAELTKYAIREGIVSL
jgi:DNA-binding NarL/FixJ family response regulator